MMPPGMGGPGGAPPPRPPKKQIGVKTARKFMKEINHVLSQESVKKAIDDAKASAKASSKASAQASREGAEAMMKAVGPIVEKAVASMVEKYKFDGGFGQAMESVQDALKRKDDPKIKAALEKFSTIMGPDKDESKEEAKEESKDEPKDAKKEAKEEQKQEDKKEDNKEDKKEEL